MSIKSKGLTVSGRAILSVTGSAPVEGIVITFSEFDQNALSGGQALEDPEGTFNVPVGFTIGGGVSGVAMYNLTTETVNALTAEAPYEIGYIWTVTWAAGSTYSTTPVTMNFNGDNLTFWILNPANTTQPISSGTFNYPAIFTPGTTPATYPF